LKYERKSANDWGRYAEIIEAQEFIARQQIDAGDGRDLHDDTLTDLASMPHLLIAGSTGHR